MTCATSGELRALLDEELAVEQRARVLRHLEGCEPCRTASEALRANAAFAASRLELLTPASAPPLVWSQLRVRSQERDRHPVTFGSGGSDMLRNLFGYFGGSRTRLAVSTLGVLVLVSLLFTLSPVQTAASSFLSIFRVKKFVAVTVDPSSLPDLASPSQLGTFTTTGNHHVRQTTMADAEKAVGFKVLTPATLPAAVDATPKSTQVTDGWTITFVPDLKKVRAYLDSIGASNVKLPDNLDGAPISAQMQPAVALLYTEKGGVNPQPDGSVKPAVGERFLYLGETTSPTMNVPDGIDVDRLRAELLQVPGLPPDLVNQIKAIEDWRNTVVVPVVKGTSRNVTVQGEPGVLVSENGGPGKTLLWLKGNVVYTMTGNVSEDELLAAANSLR